METIQKIQVVLTKNSSENELKNYFTAVLKLSRSNKEFPVDFDEVWRLVYTAKNKAVEELKSKFMQDIDFQLINQKVQAANPQGYVWEHKYYLTTSCLEFFIARKVRSVFEVYRQVFHKAAQAFSVPQTFAEALMLAAKQQQAIEEKQKQIEELQPKADYFDCLVDRKLNINFRDTAKEIGLKQNDFIKKLIDAKYIYRDAKSQLKPYAAYVGSLFIIKECKSGDKWAGNQTLVTPKGRETFNLLFGCK